MTEYLRPWKLSSLAVGIALLIAGAYYYAAPDWDVPISLIMAMLAYLTASWSMRVILERQWKHWPAMLFATWFTVDGSYWLYWRFMNPAALELRDANFFASLSLYLICGVIWLYRGSLLELLSETKRALRGPHLRPLDTTNTRSYMHQTRLLGDARLELFSQITNQISFSDFCVPAGTIEFNAGDGFLTNSLRLFQVSFPGYELEAKISDGIVFIRRNGHYQHSERFSGNECCHVAIQWDTDSIACGVVPASSTASMNEHMRAVQTPFTVPPSELIRTLRTNNLLENSSYRSADDLFATVLDCLHLCEQDIRRHGCERFAWGKGGDKARPLDEPDISRLVAGYLSSHGAARNFEVTCEPIAGSGNIDFYVLAPIQNAGLGKVAIEAKKADSQQLVHGLAVQLPQYMARMGTTYGVYLTYWLRSNEYPYPEQQSYWQLEIEKLHPIPRPPTIRTVGLDLSFGATPSQTLA